MPGLQAGAEIRDSEQAAVWDFQVTSLPPGSLVGPSTYPVDLEKSLKSAVVGVVGALPLSLGRAAARQLPARPLGVGRPAQGLSLIHI